ncbi:peptidase family M49-domain-containing protein [Xylariaceae sp. FL1272]|nr:peptidase family M49-domain-containing protein [Xylariaceae sp. FL1272]
MDSEVQIYRLSVEPLFNGLSNREKRYAHFMARAAWSGARIILRQVSRESLFIFDFILELRKSCNGDWQQLIDCEGVTRDDVNGFLQYSATFLSNIGNYFGSGDQKFVPQMSRDALKAIASRSPSLTKLYELFKDDIFSIPPYTLGFPSNSAQSSYYLGDRMSRDEIMQVTDILDSRSIFPENTRIVKKGTGIFQVLQASVISDVEEEVISASDSQILVHLTKGDHATDLRNICDNLTQAAEHAANDAQRKFLSQYIESFRTGSLEAYRDSQRTWISDKKPKVENIFGFVEPYRDPYGVRSEFEALAAIADTEETNLLLRLVENSDKFIRRLPWASSENNGKGPFESSRFDPPDFSSIHSLAYCSSIIFPGINLPNYNDIRQDTGFKSVIIANRMAAESTAKQWPFIPEEEMEVFQKHKHPAYYWWVVFHELLGHGTGRMMVEESAGKFNFDANNPPLNPLNGMPIQLWYKPGQTWTGQFADLSTTVDECRCELVGAFLMDDLELLALCGFTEETEIKASDLTYNLYQQLGVDGLRGLANFNVENMKWGQAHSRAHFAMLTCLLRSSNGCVKVEHDETNRKLTVLVNRSKIISDGKKALGEMLLRLHMYRCTADVQACREYYEDLSQVDDERLRWRETVLANKPPPMLNVQANTFLDDDEKCVKLTEYEPTFEGIIESWYERAV